MKKENQGLKKLSTVLTIAILGMGAICLHPSSARAQIDYSCLSVTTDPETGEVVKVDSVPNCPQPYNPYILSDEVESVPKVQQDSNECTIDKAVENSITKAEENINMRFSARPKERPLRASILDYSYTGDQKNEYVLKLLYFKDLHLYRITTRISKNSCQVFSSLFEDRTNAIPF